MIQLEIIKDAIFSPDRKYRYLLSRTWDDSKPSIMVIGLNPSTADEKLDDPTIKRCIAFAQSFGFGELIMVNLFGYRSTDPKALKFVWYPIGPDNNEYIIEFSNKVEKIILAWGNYGNLQNRCHSILKILPKDKLFVFGYNAQTHQPKHPLYLPKEAQLIPFGVS
jgi:hypothetical protein